MPQVWKVAPGEHADHWEVCRDRGCILLGWNRLANYGAFESEAAVLSALGGGPGDGAGAAQSIWRFTHEMEPSDIVVANRGRSSIVGIGKVRSEYLPPNSPKNPSDSKALPHARLVDWVVNQPIDLGPFFFGIPTVHLVRTKKVREIQQAYARAYPHLKETMNELFDAVVTAKHAKTTQELLISSEMQLAEEGAFDPLGIKDSRERTVSSIVRRRGQPAFRNRLLSAYERQCAVSGCEEEAVLEAAHIVPYKGSHTNHVGNGLLLRADLHTLFDLGLVAVDAMTMCLLVSAQLNGSGYETYRGKRIRIPRESADQPSREALEQHRHESGLLR